METMKMNCMYVRYTPKPLYNTVRYNMVLDQCWTPNDHLGLIFLFNYIFYSRYNTDWIAYTEIGLDPNNSVIKRLWCTNKTCLIGHLY